MWFSKADALLRTLPHLGHSVFLCIVLPEGFGNSLFLLFEPEFGVSLKSFCTEFTLFSFTPSVPSSHAGYICLDLEQIFLCFLSLDWSVGVSSSSERSLSFLSVQHGENGRSASKLSTGDAEVSKDGMGTRPKTMLAEAAACCSFSVSRGANCPDG